VHETEAITIIKDKKKGNYKLKVFALVLFAIIVALSIDILSGGGGNT
jgi:hypothetical protein